MFGCDKAFAILHGSLSDFINTGNCKLALGLLTSHNHINCCLLSNTWEGILWPNMGNAGAVGSTMMISVIRYRLEISISSSDSLLWFPVVYSKWIALALLVWRTETYFGNDESKDLSWGIFEKSVFYADICVLAYVGAQTGIAQGVVVWLLTLQAHRRHCLHRCCIGLHHKAKLLFQLTCLPPSDQEVLLLFYNKIMQHENETDSFHFVYKRARHCSLGHPVHKIRILMICLWPYYAKNMLLEAILSCVDVIKGLLWFFCCY